MGQYESDGRNTKGHKQVQKISFSSEKQKFLLATDKAAKYNFLKMCTHASATFETLILRLSSRCLNIAMWRLTASVGLAKSLSDVDGDIRPPATPSCKCRMLLSGLLTRQAFLMSTSVVFTQPG